MASCSGNAYSKWMKFRNWYLIPGRVTTCCALVPGDSRYVITHCPLGLGICTLIQCTVPMRRLGEREEYILKPTLSTLGEREHIYDHSPHLGKESIFMTTLPTLGKGAYL